MGDGETAELDEVTVIVEQSLEEKTLFQLQRNSSVPEQHEYGGRMSSVSRYCL